MKPQEVLFNLIIITFILLQESQCQIPHGNDSQLQCFRCFTTDCKESPLCNYTGEFLSQVKSSVNARSINITDLSPCPSSKDELHSSKFIETSSTDHVACGKRAIKVFATKYEFSNSTSASVSAVHPTQFPLLVPPKTPITYEYVFTLFGVTDPSSDCDNQKYTETKINKTLDSGDVIEFSALLTPESECSQCLYTLCNKDFIFSTPTTIKPPEGNSTGSDANSISSVKAGACTASLGLFFIISLFVLQ